MRSLVEGPCSAAGLEFDLILALKTTFVPRSWLDRPTLDWEEGPRKQERMAGRGLLMKFVGLQDY